MRLRPLALVLFSTLIVGSLGAQSLPERTGPVETPQVRQFETPPMPALPNDGLGEIDQPLIPGQSWRIRDLNRPKPVAVAPARHPGDAPSDAIVLFDGRDLSRWTVASGRRGRTGAAPPAGWIVRDGFVEVTPGTGGLTSRERFADLQLHVEFATPAVPLGISQYRGNSGISIGGCEIQILDNYNNPTYADGYVAAIYNQWPPLANPSRSPGEWQTLEIAYVAARAARDQLVRDAFITIILNGVLVQDNREILPSRRCGAPSPDATSLAGEGVAPVERPIALMGHPSAIAGDGVRYRNIWVRRVDVDPPTPPVSAHP
jgi:hypothetical protein